MIKEDSAPPEIMIMAMCPIPKANPPIIAVMLPTIAKQDKQTVKPSRTWAIRDKILGGFIVNTYIRYDVDILTYNAKRATTVIMLLNEKANSKYCWRLLWTIFSLQNIFEITLQ